MTCLKDIKYLTKKKVLALQPIYYVGAGLNIGNHRGKWSIIKFEGEKLEKALDVIFSKEYQDNTLVIIEWV